MHRVMVQRASYDNCREAVERAFELFCLDVKGKKVLVKPNAIRASDPEEGIVTHPALVRAVVDSLEELSAAEIVVGDNPGMDCYGANEATFSQTGLMEASKGYYRNIGSEAVELGFAPKFLDVVPVSRAVLDADVFISVPKFKTHGLTVITGAIKNSYGIIPGASKAKLHRIAGNALRFSEVLVNVYSLRIPDLFIVDAVVGMEGNGPASPDLRKIDRVLASDNGVALDAVMARMMGLDPAAVPLLDIARLHGLGDYDPATIEIVGDLEPIPDFKVVPIMEEATQTPTGMEESYLERIRVRPKADETLCTSCGTCVDQCPVSALSMIDGLPTVDPELCIACFCCQEICPEMAIKLG